MISGLVLAFPVVLFGIALSAATVATIIITGVVLVATLVLGVLLKPKTPFNNSFLTSLEQQLNPDANRIFVLGKAPGGNDERYWEVYSTSGFDQIIAVATHKVTSFQNFYINGRQVLFSGSAATGIASIGTFGGPDYTAGATTYVGALTKDNVLVGVTGTTVTGTTGAGSLWTSAASMTYCAFYRLKWNYDQKKLPQGIPSNTVQVVEGAPIYDPRKDTTVGGSGTHRANDNTTWAYSTLDSNGIPIGRNNALQMLWYLLGWWEPNIQTGVPMLLAGRGVDPGDIDYAQFIAAANECETAQFYTDMSGSTGDDHNTNEGVIAAGSQGYLIDSGGLWGYYPAVDDTASIAVAFTDDDIVGGVKWVPKSTISESFNSVAGRFIDPGIVSVYRPAPYPPVLNTTYLAQDNNMSKRISLDFTNVQNSTQAQTLARIALNRSRLTGQFSATFNWKALQAQAYSCVTLSFSAFGWVNKLFRVTSFSINPLGGCDLILKEESSLIYTGGAITTYVPRSAGQVYDATQQVPLAGFAAVAGKFASDSTPTTDAMNVSWTAPPANVQSVEVQYKQHAATAWIPFGIFGKDTIAIKIPNLLPSTSYDFQARTWSINNVPGNWASATTSTIANTTATLNSFYQPTDPALTNPVQNGFLWHNSALGKLYMRQAGSWLFIADTTAAHVDGDILFDSSTPGTYTFTIPSSALTHIDIFVFGGGGGAYDFASHGGGGGGYSYTHNFAVTAGVTVLTIVIGGGGNGADTTVPLAATAGGQSSVAASGLTTLFANGGGAATSSAGGAAGGASGGTTTNTAGEAGDTGGAGNGGANLGTGALGATGGARKTTVGAGNPPGGGAAGGLSGGSPAGNGAFGRVQIFTRT